MLDKRIIAGISVPALATFSLVGTSPKDQTYKIMVNYNGQADLLLSLQIPPDYYPYQFKKTKLYDYLTDVDKYIVANDYVSENKKKIKNSLQKKLSNLLGQVKEFGPSLWNADLYDTGLVFRNDQFWNNKKTSLLFLEQFIADDYVNINEALDLLPSHKRLIVTNYRAARDPYTIFSKKVFKCWEENGIVKVRNQANEQECDQKSKQLSEKFKKYVNEYKQEDINSLYRFGKYIEFWNSLFKDNEKQLDELGISNWLKESNLFSLDTQEDQELANKYEKTIFTKKEKALLSSWDTGWKINYFDKSNIRLSHHPALEQQILPGTAPLAEGSQKDVIVFLFQFAALIDHYTKTPAFKQEFERDPRKEAMQAALDNAKKMSKDLEKRIENIRNYFKFIKVVDKNFDPGESTSTNTDSKSFAVVTFPPTSFGAGEATIQSMSKFPFIYSDIGLKQVIPKNLKLTKSEITKVHSDHSEEEEESLENETFSVDDNGWWWKIGNANIDPTNLLEFKDQADTLLLLANEDDWNLLRDKNSGTLKAVSSILKKTDGKNENDIDVSKVNKGDYPVSYNKYHLWNEGLRSPIALNLLLDNLVDIFQRQYDSGFSSNHDFYKHAMDWGDYWSTDFIKMNEEVEGSTISKARGRVSKRNLERLRVKVR